MMKFSDYLDKILSENSKIEFHNISIKKKIEWYKKRSPDMSEEQIMSNIARGYANQSHGKLLDRLHVPSMDELKQMFGGEWKHLEILGKIGESGREVHKISIVALSTPEGWIVYHASSHCGSQKWNVENPSPIFPFESDDLSKVTCDRCNGVRVKGGKEQPTQYKCTKCSLTSIQSTFKGHFAYGLACPKCKTRTVVKLDKAGVVARPKIDPDSRPKEYYFKFKIDYPADQWGPARIGEEKRESAKGMTEQEAMEKVKKNEERFDRVYPVNERRKLYDFVCDTIYSWNGHLIWSAKSGEPKPGTDVLEVSEKSLLEPLPEPSSKSGSSSPVRTEHRESGGDSALGSMRG